MRKDDLDKEYPQGSPTSPSCRWCLQARVVEGKAILCETCDRPTPVPGQ